MQAIVVCTPSAFILFSAAHASRTFATTLPGPSRFPLINLRRRVFGTIVFQLQSAQETNADGPPWNFCNLVERIDEWHEVLTELLAYRTAFLEDSNALA